MYTKKKRCRRQEAEVAKSRSTQKQGHVM